MLKRKKERNFKLSTPLSVCTEYSISQLKLESFQPVLQTKQVLHGMGNMYRLIASVKPVELRENLRALSELDENNIKFS